jgi:hypothetical protein
MNEVEPIHEIRDINMTYSQFHETTILTYTIDLSNPFPSLFMFMFMFTLHVKCFRFMCS